MVRQEITLKQIRVRLAGLYPQARFFTDKALGSISSQWKQLIRVNVQSPPASATIEFCSANLAHLNFNEQAIRDALVGVGAREDENMQWCS
eukprot:8663817-Pyramimonas_sp.AAC.1